MSVYWTTEVELPGKTSEDICGCCKENTEVDDVKEEEAEDLMWRPLRGTSDFSGHFPILLMPSVEKLPPKHTKAFYADPHKEEPL